VTPENLLAKAQHLRAVALLVTDAWLLAELRAMIEELERRARGLDGR
jgi:hypothetical protein